MTMQEQLEERIRNLAAHREEIVNRAKGEVAAIDAKLLALRDLYAQWNSLTIEQAIVKLAAAGITVSVQG